jgi:hypothetical protein
MRESMIRALRATAAVIVVIVVAGCSTATTNQGPINDRVIARAGDAVLHAHERDQLGPVPVEAPPDKVMAALNAAYADLGIEVKLWDPPHGEVGNKSFTKMYRLAGASLSQYLSCGLTTNGDAADTYRVTLSLVSHVTRATGGSTVLTSLSGIAEDLASSKGTVTCETRGILEDKVLQYTLRHLST